MVDKYYTERREWRYQRGNQNPQIEDEQTTQWPEEKNQKDNQVVETTSSPSSMHKNQVQ